MQNNEWFRLIVPGALFLIWIVNQLLNKELKPNPADRPVGIGPRPGGPPPTPRTSPRDPRDPTMRFTTTPTARPGPIRSAADDEVIVIRAEPPRFPERATNSGPPKRPARQKKPAARPAEPAKARTLSSGVSQKLNSPLDQQSLVDEPTSLSLSMPPAVSTGLGISPSPTAVELLKTFGSQQALREAFLINELLQPPLSMRRNHRR
jgi:hypothetical protein